MRTRNVWLVAGLAGLSVAWPMIYAALRYGPSVLTRSLIGDSYHYLAIARKAHQSGIFTYDGVHVTNGFHPLWEYFQRAMFAVLHLQSHEAQATAVMVAASLATTIGVVLTSAAVIRMTHIYFTGLLIVPGLYYMVAGVHVKNFPIWGALDGMESAFSILFGGAFFFLLSWSIGSFSGGKFDSVKVFQVLGFRVALCYFVATGRRISLTQFCRSTFLF